jgi:hypothetical protein
MLCTTSDDMECGMWNVGWCINVKSKDRLYKSLNGSTGMGKKECSSIACWEGSHYIESKKKCVGGCAWQKQYNENVMVKFQLQCWEICSNTLKYIETFYKCIEI